MPRAAKTLAPSFRLPTSTNYIRTAPGKPQAPLSDIPKSRFGAGSTGSGSLSVRRASPAPTEANQANQAGEPEDQAGEQSPGLVGELWLDTLSLQNWLQTYLTDQMQSRSGMAAKAESAFAFI
jgi:hypothetical protein